MMSLGTFGGGGVRFQSSEFNQSRKGCLSNDGGVCPEATRSAGHNRDESGVMTSSHTTSSPSTKPSSNLVSARIRPWAASRSAARSKRSRQRAEARASNSSPTMAAAVVRSIFMSWPVSAFVEGVNSGFSNASVNCIPAGTSMKWTVPLTRYSSKAWPASRARTMHSSGNISALRTSMVRPCQSLASANPGTNVSITAGSHETSAVGTEANSLTQKCVSPVRTRPLLGMDSFITTSKALRRSEATIKRWSSPTRYRSRTLPL